MNFTGIKLYKTEFFQAPFRNLFENKHIIMQNTGTLNKFTAASNLYRLNYYWHSLKGFIPVN